MSYRNYTVEDTTSRLGGSLSGYTVEGAEPLTPAPPTGIPEPQVPIPDIIGPNQYDPVYPGLINQFKETGMKAVGAGETAMSLASGLLSTGLVGTAMTGSIFKGMLMDDKSFEQAANDAIPMLERMTSKMTYQPYTQYGKELVHEFGKAMEVPRQVSELLGDDIIYFLNGQAQLMKATPDMPQYGLKAKRLPDLMGPEYVQAVREAGLDTNKFLAGAVKNQVLNNIALQENHRRVLNEWYDNNDVLPPETIAKIAAVVGIPLELWIWGKGMHLIKGTHPKVAGMSNQQFKVRQEILKKMEERGDLPQGTIEKFNEAAEAKAEEIIENGLDETDTPAIEKQAHENMGNDAKNILVEDPEIADVMGLSPEKIAENNKLRYQIEARQKDAIGRAKQGTDGNPTLFIEENEPGVEAWQDIADKAGKPIKVRPAGKDSKAEVTYYPQPKQDKVKFVDDFVDEDVIREMRESAEADELANLPVDEFADTPIEFKSGEPLLDYAKKKKTESIIARQVEEANSAYEDPRGLTVTPEEIKAQEALGKKMQEAQKLGKDGADEFVQRLAQGDTPEQAIAYVQKLYEGKKPTLAKKIVEVAKDLVDYPDIYIKDGTAPSVPKRSIGDIKENIEILETYLPRHESKLARVNALPEDASVADIRRTHGLSDNQMGSIEEVRRYWENEIKESKEGLARLHAELKRRLSEDAAPKKQRFSSVVRTQGGKNYKTEKGLIKKLTRDYGDAWKDNYWIQGDKADGFYAERIPEMKKITPATQLVLDQMGLEKPTPRQIANADRLAKKGLAKQTETYLRDTGEDAHQIPFEERQFNLDMALKRASREPDGVKVDYFKDQINQLVEEKVFTKEEGAKLTERPDAMILDDLDVANEGIATTLMQEIVDARPSTSVASEQAKGVVKLTKDLMSDESGYINLFRDNTSRSLQEAREKIAAGLDDFFYDRPDVRSETYANVFNAIEDLRINQNLGAFDAQLIRTMLHEKISSDQAARDISHWIEGKDVTLSPRDQAVAEIVKEVYARLGTELMSEGILSEFLSDFVNHIIKPTTKAGKQFATKSAASFIQKRVRKEGVKGTLTIDQLKEIGREKGFTVEDDIRTLLPTYFYYAKRSLARKQFANYMVTGETPEGHQLMYPTGQVPLEIAHRYVDMADVTPIKRWSRFGRKSTGIEDPALVKARNKLLKGDVSVHRDAWKLVENLLAEETSSAITLFDHARGFTKRLIMFNPLIHGLNVESNVLLSMGITEYAGARSGRPGRLSGMTGRSQAELSSTLRRMVKNGVQLEGLYEVGHRLAADNMELRLENMSMKQWLDNVIQNPSRAIHPADLFRRIKTVGKLNDILLWDRIVKTGQVAIYRSLEAKYLRQGYNTETAGRMAAMQANDYMGTLPKTWFTKKQRTLMRKLLFARDWNVGLWRSLSGALPGKAGQSGALPKFLRFEGVTPEMMGGFTGKGNPFKGIKGQYREMLVRGALYLVTFNNAIQMGLLAANGQDARPTWENEEGHKLDIDTGTVDAKGRKVYIRGWMFRQIGEYAHLAAAAVEGDIDEAIKIARNKIEPILATTVGLFMNVDFRNEPIRHPGATGKEKLLESGRFALEGVTPSDTLLGRRGEVRNLWEKLTPWTGTFVRHGMPAGGDILMGDMLKDYYEWNDHKEYKNIVSARDIEEQIQRGDWDESLDAGVSAMLSGHMTKGQFKTLIKRNPEWGNALFGRITTSGGGLESDFKRFLNDMGENEPKKFDAYSDRVEELGKELKEAGTKPVPESTRLRAKLSIFKMVRAKEGGWVNNPDDPGGETIFGISRFFHPKWQGWKRVDFLNREGVSKGKINQDARLHQYADNFYNEYWKDFGVDGIKDYQLQEMMFEFGMNTRAGTTRSALRALGISSRKGTHRIGKKLTRGLNALDTPEKKRDFIRKFSDEMRRHYSEKSRPSLLDGLQNKIDNAEQRFLG